MNLCKRASAGGKAATSFRFSSGVSAVLAPMIPSERMVVCQSQTMLTGLG